MSQDSLQPVPIEKWPELQKSLLADWPRCLPGYNILETQTLWKQRGLDYGFQAFCPFGDLQNGFVAINEKVSSYDIIIQYPKDDTKILGESLRATKTINWDTRNQIKIPFAAAHVIECIRKIVKDKNLEVKLTEKDNMDTFYMDKESPMFDVELPPGHSFKLLTSEHVDFIDSYWPHRYPTSSSYFKLLIDSKSGYGIFKDGELISWMLIGECGNLTHLYTLESHRKKGYAELLVKLISNATIKDRNRDVFAFCVKSNVAAHKLYEKIGLKKSNDVFWPDVCKIQKPQS